MSKELTEKWKNGELDCGWYYIKIYWGAGYDTIFDYNTANGEFADFGKKSVKEVLAPVPTFDEYQKLKEQLEEANAVIETLRTYDFTIDDENAEEYQVKWNVQAKKIYENKKWSIK